MTGELMSQVGIGSAFAVAFFGLATWVLQAVIRGTWNPKSQVDRLLEGKDQLIKLKDEQIALLVAEKATLQTSLDNTLAQNSGLIEGMKTVKHFFSEVPVVPSIGDTDESGT